MTESNVKRNEEYIVSPRSDVDAGKPASRTPEEFSMSQYMAQFLMGAPMIEVQHIPSLLSTLGNFSNAGQPIPFPLEIPSLNTINPGDDAAETKEVSTAEENDGKSTRKQPLRGTNSKDLDTNLSVLAQAANPTPQQRASLEQIKKQALSMAPSLADVPEPSSPGDARAEGEEASFDEGCVGLDDKEIKKLKRKQSNRESARRSRQKKQEEYEKLAGANDNLRLQLARKDAEILNLQAQLAALQNIYTMHQQIQIDNSKE